jgi:hypothetical protein
MCNEQKKSIWKIIPVILWTLILVSNISTVAAINTEMDPISPITCKQGDVAEITVQLWIKGEFWNGPLNGEEVTFCIYDGNLKILFYETTKTNWINGKAGVEVNTKNFEPGNYLLSVYYFGNTGLLDFDPCGTDSKFGVTT